MVRNETVSSIPKTKVRIWVYSLRKNFVTILLCIFTICLVLFSKTNLVAAKNGLILWATAVVPSLFPFFVATEMLSYTNVVSYLGKWLTPIMKPIFGVPGEAAFAFIMGLISGYPVNQQIITYEEAERLLAFTNNSGPLFIIGTVGITLFGNTSIGILLFVTHVLACISVGIALNIFTKHQRKSTSLSTNIKNTKPSNYNSSISFSSLGEILGNSIKNATSTIFLIGGFVVIFSVIISILNHSHILPSNKLLEASISGIVELTNGVSLVSNIHFKSISINIILCAFLLGFGGISVLLQVVSIVSKNKISIKKYIYGKLLQGIFAAFYTFIALEFIPFLQFNL